MVGGDMKGKIALGRWHLTAPNKWNWSRIRQVIRSRIFWLRTIVVAIVILIATPVFGAPILPGNPMYPLKRVGETLLTALTPDLTYQHVKAKEGIRAIYAARRLNEAA